MKTKITAGIFILTIFLSSCAKETFFFSNTGSSYGSKKATEVPAAAATEAAPTEATEVYLAATDKAAAVSTQELAQAKALYTAPVAAAPKQQVSKVAQVKAAVKLNKEIKTLVKEAKKNNMPAAQAEGKSQVVALILVLLVGALGIHRFYLGYTGIGIAQLLTLGGCGIWALIDLVRIITGDLKPKDGDYTKTL
ncbi:MAG: TM2 domain-containing protein [Adhaeribacter sp.]